MKTFISADKSISIIIEQQSFRAMINYCKKAKRKETGGVLIGKYTENFRVAQVTYIVGPAKDSKFGSSWFYRGFDGLQNLINKLWKENQGHYVGEWHFHPYSSPKPSPQDIQQMQEISNNKNYQCKEPILVIIGGDPNADFLVHVCIIKNNNAVVLNIN